MRFSHYTQSFLFLVLLLSGVPAFAQQNRVFIEDHDSLTVYYPRFNRIDFVTKQMPQKSEKDVIFVCAASFTGELLDEFKHSNIAGHHVTSGSFHKGYKCGPYNGVFTWSARSGWHFYNYSHKNSEPPLTAVAAEGGMGYCQSLLFYNGKRFKGCMKPERTNRYRALCEIGGKLCIVDCARSLPFGHFMDGLEKLGVKNALYCDMGRGWNYSWYRKDNDTVQELFPTPGQYTTNWIAFYE
jgi:hypothetical protein